MNSNSSKDKLGFEPLTSHSPNPAQPAGFGNYTKNNRPENDLTFFPNVDNKIDSLERKKMQNFQNLRKPTPSYRAAILVESKNGWYIEYYIWNPFTKEKSLEQKRNKLNRILKRYKRVSDKKRQANKIVEEYNHKLAHGWNPYLEDQLPQAFSTIEDACNDFIKIYGHNKRKITTDDYHKFFNQFRKFLEKHNKYDEFIISIDKYIAIAFIDYIYIEKKSKLRTRKNYLDFFTTAFNWFVERGYVKTNPFKSVQRISIIKETKARTPITQDFRPQIVQHFLTHRPGYIYVINYLFLCLIRRTEMTKLKVENLFLHQQMIYIPADVAKNNRERYVTIPDDFFAILQKIEWTNIPNSYFLVSDADFYPGKKQLNPRKITTTWNSMKKKVGIPKENQFYSLRDTGVIDYMQSGIDNKTMVDHANWQSYDMISVYASHLNRTANQKIKLGGKLFG